MIACARHLASSKHESNRIARCDRFIKQLQQVQHTVERSIAVQRTPSPRPHQSRHGILVMMQHRKNRSTSSSLRYWRAGRAAVNLFRYFFTNNTGRNVPLKDGDHTDDGAVTRQTKGKVNEQRLPAKDLAVYLVIMLATGCKVPICTLYTADTVFRLYFILNGFFLIICSARLLDY